MPTEAIGLALVALFVGICITGVVTWGFAAFYMIKTLGRFHQDREWGKYIPVSLFIPWFFTEEGNKYRVKLLRAAGLFIVLVAAGFGIGMLTSTIKP